MAAINIPKSRIEPGVLNPVVVPQVPLAFASEGKAQGVATGLGSAARAVAGVSELALAAEEQKNFADNERTVRLLEKDLNGSIRSSFTDYSLRKGVDAIPSQSGPQETRFPGVTRAFEDDYNTRFEKITNGYSPEIVAALELKTSTRKRAMLDSLSGTEASEAAALDAVLIDTLVEQANNAADDLFADEKGADIEIGNAASEISKKKGLPPELIELSIEKNTSQALQRGILLLAPKNSAAARERLERRKEEIGARGYAKTLEVVETYRAGSEASAWVDANTLGVDPDDLNITNLKTAAGEYFKGDDKASAAAKKLIESEVHSARIEKNYHESIKNEGIVAQLQTLMSQGKFHEAYTEIALHPDPKFKTEWNGKVDDLSKGKRRRSDPLVESKLAALSNEQLKLTDLTKVANLSTDDYDKWADHKEELIATGKASNELIFEGVKADETARAYVELGIKFENGKVEKDSKHLAATFDRKLADRIVHFKADPANENRDPNKDDLRLIVNDMLFENIIEREGFWATINVFSDFTDRARNFELGTRADFLTTDSILPARYASEIPPIKAEQFRKAMAAENGGVPPTDTELVVRYNKRNEKKTPERVLGGGVVPVNE